MSVGRPGFNREENRSTFILPNTFPRLPSAWNLLEAYTQKLVADGNETYIITGTYGKGGIGDRG